MHANVKADARTHDGSRIFMSPLGVTSAGTPLGGQIETNEIVKSETMIPNCVNVAKSG